MKFFGKNNILSVGLDLQTIPTEIENVKGTLRNYQTQFDNQTSNLEALQTAIQLLQNKIIDLDTQMVPLVSRLSTHVGDLSTNDFSDLSEQILQLKTEKEEYQHQILTNENEIESMRLLQAEIVRKQNDATQELIRLEDKLARKKKQMSEMRR